MPPAVPSHQTLRFLSQLCAKPLSCRPSLVHCPYLTQRSRPFSSSYPSCTPSSKHSALRTQRRGVSSTSSSSSSPSPSSPLADEATLPDTSTFYSLFPSTLPHGPPPHPSSSFAIDLRTLRREFLALQSRFHPDKYDDAASATHRRALALSSLINDAYRTLSDPLLRAQYLLHLRYGIDVTSEDNSQFPIDQATLIEVMDVQEAVEEAQSSDEVDRLREENRQRMEEAVRKVGEAFEHDDKDTATRECVRLKYWRSLQQGLDDWEPGKEVRLVH